MAVYTIYTLEDSNVSVSNGKQLSGAGGGSHLNGETITLNNGNWVAVDVDDSDDSSFGDSDSSQTLDTATTYDGTAYAAGLRVEAEYALTVEDSSGNIYTLVAVNINEPGTSPAWSTIEGLAFIGGADEFPPIGVALTVTNAIEGPNYAFSSIAYPVSPTCFTKGNQIKTLTGLKSVENLKVGDFVATKDNGYQKIRWIGARKFSANDLAINAKLKPVRIMAGALGQNLPRQDISVSRQHRILVSSTISQRMFGETDVLVAAIKLTELPGIFVDNAAREVEYFHILFDQHEVIFAEGTAMESLYTGPEALKSVLPEAREEILSIFPELRRRNYVPKPARYIPSTKQQKRLVERHVKHGQPVLR